MSQGIFLIQADESLVELAEEPYKSEALLQELISKYPNLLSGDQPSGLPSRRWLLVKREMGVPDNENASDRWSLDHLFLDQDGVPTLVEVKRASDTRIRREVVGQMLDYAANSVVYWPVEKLQEEIAVAAARQKKEPDILIQEYLGEEGDISAFWQSVKDNISKGRIRLIFVADRIPRELQRIIEFLNRQMSPAEVYGVEMKQYVGMNVRSLVPRAIGLTGDKPTSLPAVKRTWTRESFVAVLESRQNQRDLDLAKQIISWMDDRGLRIAGGGGQYDGSLFAMLDLDGENLYTFALRTGYANAYIQLQFALLLAPFDTHERRLELANRILRATGIKMNNESVDKFPSIKLSVLNKSKIEAILSVFDWYIEQCRYSKDDSSVSTEGA